MWGKILDDKLYLFYFLALLMLLNVFDMVGTIYVLEYYGWDSERNKVVLYALENYGVVTTTIIKNLMGIAVVFYLWVRVSKAEFKKKSSRVMTLVVLYGVFAFYLLINLMHVFHIGFFHWYLGGELV